MPGQGQLPGQVVGVPQPLVEPLGAQRAQQMCRVPGEEGPADAPAPGQPVVHGVDPGVDQFVRRASSRPHQPASAARTRATSASGVTSSARGRQQPVDPPDAFAAADGRSLPRHRNATAASGAAVPRRARAVRRAARRRRAAPPRYGRGSARPAACVRWTRRRRSRPDDCRATRCPRARVCTVTPARSCSMVSIRLCPAA